MSTSSVNKSFDSGLPTHVSPCKNALSYNRYNVEQCTSLTKGNKEETHPVSFLIDKKWQLR